MKTELYNPGACGIEQILYLGKVAYNTEDIDDGVALKNKLPAGFVVTRFVCNVKTAFNAATTNVLVLGTATDDDAYLAAGDITEGSIGYNGKFGWTEVGTTDIEVKAKYTSTGTAATAGEAEFYAFIAKVEV